MTGHAPVLVVAALGISAVVASVTPNSPHYIWNLTPSVPLGLYREALHTPIDIASLVVAVPPEPLATVLDLNGYLPRGVPLLKRVLALPGQRVCRLGTTITVDAVTLPSLVRMRDARGRPLPSWHGCHRIAENEVFLMNWQSDNSLDGRYFGVLPRRAVVAAAIPVWTDEAGDGRFVWHAPTR